MGEMEAVVPQRLAATINGKLKLDPDMAGGLNGEWANAFLQAPPKQGSNTVKRAEGTGGCRSIRSTRCRPETAMLIPT